MEGKNEIDNQEHDSKMLINSHWIKLKKTERKLNSLIKLNGTYQENKSLTFKSRASFQQYNVLIKSLNIHHKKFIKTCIDLKRNITVINIESENNLFNLAQKETIFVD